MVIQQAATSTVDLLLQRMNGGDIDARNQLSAAVYEPLEHLTLRRLKRFPVVRRWDEGGDVLNSALVRLMGALDKVQPASEQEFFRLAVEEIHRELVDRARHYSGPAWRCTHDTARAERRMRVALESGLRDDSQGPMDQENWAAFQQAVEHLPTEERGVVSLLFYHGWTQAQVGKLLHVTVRTVQHHWQSASRKLLATLAPRSEPGQAAWAN
jgi:RNA polymerase sigma factor (sigma-70 family)